MKKKIKQTKLEKFMSFHLAYLTGSKFDNCPFCGHKPREVLSIEKETSVGYINQSCGLYNHVMPLEQWEKRVTDNAPVCDVCGKQDKEVGSCDKCSLSVCEDCVSIEGWCLECVYDFGKGAK